MTRLDSFGSRNLGGPVVSVVVTNYNYGHFLERAVASIQAQDYVDLEILIADDASTDNSLAVAEQLRRTDARIKILSREENVGLAKNKQSACRAATGAFISFLDADDYLCHVSKISAEVAAILEHEERAGATCVAYSARQTIDGEDVVASSIAPAESASGDIFMGVITRTLREIPRDFTLRTDAFWRSGGFDEQSLLYVDWVLKIRLASQLYFVPTQIVGIAYVKHGASMSSVASEVHRKAILRGYLGHRHLIRSCSAKASADFLMWKKYGWSYASDVTRRVVFAVARMLRIGRT